MVRLATGSCLAATQWDGRHPVVSLWPQSIKRRCAVAVSTALHDPCSTSKIVTSTHSLLAEHPRPRLERVARLEQPLGVCLRGDEHPAWPYPHEPPRKQGGVDKDDDQPRDPEGV